MKQYYVYVYLDTRKPGVYDFQQYSFDYEPIYIGKGTGKRLDCHLKQYYKANAHLKRKIGKIIDLTGSPPVILKIKDGLSEDQAFDLEKSMIGLIGRLDLKTGTLCNMTFGGEGLVGCSEETKNKLRKPFSIERRNNISRATKGRIVSNEIKGRLLSYAFVPVVHFDAKMNVIKEYDTVSEAIKDLNVTGASIHRYCTCYFNKSDGTTVRYKKDILGHSIYIENKENDKKRKYIKNSREK